CADQRLCDAAWHALRARLVERHGVTRYRFSRTEAAESRARCPQGEPSAMLPAVSAALAEWSPEGHRDASEPPMQKRPGAKEPPRRTRPLSIQTRVSFTASCSSAQKRVLRYCARTGSPTRR